MLVDNDLIENRGIGYEWNPLTAPEPVQETRHGDYV